MWVSNIEQHIISVDCRQLWPWFSVLCVMMPCLILSHRYISDPQLSSHLVLFFLDCVLRSQRGRCALPAHLRSSLHHLHTHFGRYLRFTMGMRHLKSVFGRGVNQFVGYHISYIVCWAFEVPRPRAKPDQKGTDSPLLAPGLIRDQPIL